MDLCSVDCIVACDMEIVEVCGYFVTLWNIVEYSLRGRSYSICVSKTFSLLEGFLCPYSSLEISCLVLKEVHCDIEETHACSSTEEQDFIIFRNVQEFSPECAALVHYSFPLFCAV